MKAKPKVRNWSEYNKALIRRGQIIFSFTEEGLNQLYYRGIRQPGGDRLYSPFMYEYILAVKVLFKLPWRSAVGLVEGLLKKMFALEKVAVPNFAHASREANKLGLKVKKYQRNLSEGINLALDSTGLNVYTASGWHQSKYGKKSLHHQKDQWKKMHIAMDINTMEVLSVTCTSSRRNDCEQIAALMEEIKGKVNSIRADGAYDTGEMYRIGYERGSKVLIPPACTSKAQEELSNPPKKLKPHLAARDKTIKEIRRCENFDEGLKEWKRSSLYHKRSQVEAFMFRFKRIFGYNLHQKTENGRLNEIICKVNLLNLMTSLGKAEYA